jgi:hypothetical protein
MLLTQAVAVVAQTAAMAKAALEAAAMAAMVVLMPKTATPIKVLEAAEELDPDQAAAEELAVCEL